MEIPLLEYIRECLSDVSMVMTAPARVPDARQPHKAFMGNGGKNVGHVALG